jgi:hypothetical protein
MYSQLCDRCLACSHEILVKYEFKTEFENHKDAISHLKFLLDCINGTYKELHLDYEIRKLNYSFLEDTCNECVGAEFLSSRTAIKMYNKIYIVNKIFEIVTQSKFKDYWLNNEKFLITLRNKLITIHLSIVGNDESVLYYNQELIEYDDLGYIPYYKELAKLPIFYEKIFGVPMYLANLSKEQYLLKKSLNLEENIVKHCLCLK